MSNTLKPDNRRGMSKYESRGKMPGAKEISTNHSGNLKKRTVHFTQLERYVHMHKYYLFA